MLHVNTAKISRYLDGELNDTAAERLERHVARCASCRKRVEILRESQRAFPPPSRERLDAVARGVMSRVGPREWNAARSGARTVPTDEALDTPIMMRATPVRRWTLALAAAALWCAGVLTAMYASHVLLKPDRQAPSATVDTARTAGQTEPGVAEGATPRIARSLTGEGVRTGGVSPSGAIGSAVGETLPAAAKTFSLPKRDGYMADDQAPYNAYRREPRPSSKDSAPGGVSPSTPVAGVWDHDAELDKRLKNTRWQWDGEGGETILFREDGSLDHPAWAREGFTASWRVVDRRTVLVYAERGESNDIRAVLVFSEDMSLFQGYSVRGVAQVKESRPVESAQPLTPPR